MRWLCALTAVALIAAAHVPQLIGQDGHAFTLAQLQGAPIAVTFVSAHCRDACPLIDGQFADAARRLAAAHVHARLVTITLDPAHDPPSVMAALARRFDADPRWWLVAGGSVGDVERLMHAFGVTAIPGKYGYAEQHSTFVYLFDCSGRLALTTLASTALNDVLVERLQALAGARGCASAVHGAA